MAIKLTPSFLKMRMIYSNVIICHRFKPQRKIHLIQLLVEVEMIIFQTSPLKIIAKNEIHRQKIFSLVNLLFYDDFACSNKLFNITFQINFAAKLVKMIKIREKPRITNLILRVTLFDSLCHV